jgi:hypothetical protein
VQSRYQRTQVPKELQFMILRTRLPFLCNMATTTCKPAAEPVLPLVRTVRENVQSRDTFCLHRLSPRSDSGATSSTCPRCMPQHAMTAAGKSEIMRGYQEIFCDTCFQPLSFKSRSESASRGSNLPGAANTIVRKSFGKVSMNEMWPS